MTNVYSDTKTVLLSALDVMKERGRTTGIFIEQDTLKVCALGAILQVESDNGNVIAPLEWVKDWPQDIATEEEEGSAWNYLDRHPAVAALREEISDSPEKMSILEGRWYSTSNKTPVEYVYGYNDHFHDSDEEVFELFEAAAKKAA